ncbi:MAG: signal peptide peptidase SppA [Myxococcota bacterium]|nr:signal peptide peptidase SppA [Myxococcota bacterium]
MSGEKSAKSTLGRWFMRGCLMMVIGFFVLPMIMGTLFSILLSNLEGSGERGRLQEVHVQGPIDAPHKVALIEASGVMLRGGGGIGAKGGISGKLLGMIEHAKEDTAVRGVMLRVNTPGGSLTDADLIHHAIEQLRGAGKSVLFLMDDTCASGGFYISLAADEVWALPTTITGSIGVIIQNYNFSGLLERVGVEDSSISSGPNKALLSSSRPRNPEHEAIIQHLIDEFQARFVRLFAAGRGLDEAKAAALADGRIYSAQQALEQGLIDKVAYPEEALERALELARGAESVRRRRVKGGEVSVKEETEESAEVKTEAPLTPSPKEAGAYRVVRYRAHQSLLESLSEAIWRYSPLTTLGERGPSLRSTLPALTR